MIAYIINSVQIGSVVSEEKIFFKFHPPFFLICTIGQNQQKFKNHIIYVKKLIIMLIQFKFGPFEEISIFSNSGHLG